MTTAAARASGRRPALRPRSAGPLRRPRQRSLGFWLSRYARSRAPSLARAFYHPLPVASAEPSAAKTKPKGWDRREAPGASIQDARLSAPRAHALEIQQRLPAGTHAGILSSCPCLGRGPNSRFNLHTLISHQTGGKQVHQSGRGDSPRPKREQRRSQHRGVCGGGGSICE